MDGDGLRLGRRLENSASSPGFCSRSFSKCSGFLETCMKCGTTSTWAAVVSVGWRIPLAGSERGVVGRLGAMSSRLMCCASCNARAIERQAWVAMTSTQHTSSLAATLLPTALALSAGVNGLRPDTTCEPPAWSELNGSLAPVSAVLVLTSWAAHPSAASSLCR